MNERIQNTININGTDITSYNNINIDLTLSFNNLSYTLSYENNRKYLTTNSLLFNIEDTDSIYNIYKHNDIQFAYQLNNILFIDNDKNMHILSYNLRNDQKFTIDNNHLLTFNTFEKTSDLMNQINWQPIFTYNSKNISYIYSSEDKLTFMSMNKPGLYYIDNDDVILNNDRLSINIDKFNYNYLHINNMVNKINNILYNYSYNINLFGQTKKYKNSTHTNNLSIIENYDNCEIKITTSNRSYKLNYCEDLDIFIKDTNYLIIDFPIEYEYETVINTDFKYNRNMCPINIQQFEYEISKTSIKSKIALNRFKSFIYDNNPISINYIQQNDEDNHSKLILKESCRVSLYFNLDTNIYKEVYNSFKNPINDYRDYNFKFEINIHYKTISYNLNCYIDVMNNQFKKLYHNYNYGFNYDNHGDIIGIMFLPKNTNTSLDNYTNYNININDNIKSIISGNHELSDNYELYPINKDVFINYNPYSFDDTLIKSNRLNYDQLNRQWNSMINFSKMYYREISTVDNGTLSERKIESPNLIIQNLLYPKRLKCNNFTFLYKNNYQTIYNFPNFEGTKNVLIDNTNLCNIGTINLFKIKGNTINVNNPYIMDKDQHKSIFNQIYNYRKSGLLCGDYYTPCLLDYTLIYLFGIENLFNQTIYKTYINQFGRKNSINSETPTNDETTTNDETQTITYQYRFLTNQFYQNNSKIFEYSVNLSKNGDQDSFNNYIVDLYNLSPQNINEYDVNYIWPLFRIPDYSIINSNNYIIMYSDKENCEYLDYYIHPSSQGNYFNINFRSYNEDNLFEFKILDEQLRLANNIQISSTNLIDKENNIYQMRIYIQNISKVNIMYIIFKDSEEYMNNIKITPQKGENHPSDNNKYRILCKVYLKNKDI